MKKLITILFINFIFLFSSLSLVAQTAKNPVEITVMNPAASVSPGAKSYISVQIKIPKGIWLGANVGEARTPPATKIYTPEIDGFTFEKPQFPPSIKEWVPAKLGTTQVFKELVNVIIPYTVESGIKEGSYDLPIEITYSPGYNAGRLATHNNEKHSTTVKVAKNSSAVTILDPTMGNVSDDFYVKAKSYENIPSMIRFLFNPLNENSGGVKALHNIWLDKPGHGKTVRIMPFPLFTTTNISGTALGMGISFANSTKEGIMTGMFAMSGYYNDLIGGAFSLQAISCPGAYHNYQFSAEFGGEGYRNVTLHYENFTMANSSFGLDLNFASTNEPRMRFYGVGSQSTEENQTAYEQTKLNGILDLYSLPM